MINCQQIFDLGLDFPSGSPEHMLYALVDHAGVPGLCAQLKRTGTEWISLFHGSRDEGALEVAPILFPIVVAEASFRQNALVRWICENGSYSSSLIFLVSPLAIGELSRRLALRLDAQLPENMVVVLRYFDARIFESMLIVLSDEQKLNFLSPAPRWWYVDRRGELQTVDAAFDASDGRCIPLIFTAFQESALLDASEPDQVGQMLRTFVPVEYAKLAAGKDYDFVMKNMEYARAFGVASTHDHALFCSLALLEGDSFSERAKWSEALKKFANGNSFSDAIESTESHDEEI